MNSIWSGSKIQVFGAKNEVVGFNVVLEAATTTATGVSVTFNQLVGPSGSSIKSVPVTGNGVFDWTQRNIELFYVKYLQIKGLSLLGYENYYDERHVPKRLRRPWTGAGTATAGTKWTDRADHDKFYPDIVQPLELAPTFAVSQGKNQSIWVDVFVPKTANAGLYTGSLNISENGQTTRSIPVEMVVRNFTLPDVPTAKTMLHFGDFRERYIGNVYPNPGSPEALKVAAVSNKHLLLAHRHKISLIGDDAMTADQPTSAWIPAVNGSLFTAANGYDGPGVGTGNNVYSIGTYGSWQAPWGTTQAGIQAHANAWETWFQLNSPTTERFVYLVDESTNYAQTEQWANWMKTNPGVGSKLPSLATISLINASSSVPSLWYPTSGAGFYATAAFDAAYNTLKLDPLKKLYLYNGIRPGVGCFMTEDDGVSLRANAWTQYKKGVSRWFYWQSTYYNDFQGGRGNIDVFNNANTFGGVAPLDPTVGETGWNHSNGDGVLFYPGTDKLFPASSLGIDGPIASLRLKAWRRGIQDVDYLTLAAAKNPAAVQALVNTMVPKVAWEVGVDNPADPTYVHSDISWSTNPDVWESARKQLADIIDP